MLENLQDMMGKVMVIAPLMLPLGCAETSGKGAHHPQDGVSDIGRALEKVSQDAKMNLGRILAGCQSLGMVNQAMTMATEDCAIGAVEVCGGSFQEVPNTYPVQIAFMPTTAQMQECFDDKNAACFDNISKRLVTSGICPSQPTQ